MGAVSESFGQEGSASGRPEFERLRRVSQRVLFAIPNPPKIEWLVFDDPSINAGATFGEIVVSTGMLRFVRSDDELALILGHELAHITQGHVSQGAMNTSLLGLGSQVVNAIYPGIGLLTGQAGQLFLNRYNQDQERAADVVGLRYAFAAGYDPRAAAQVMRRMAHEEPHTATAGFFSSHPSSLERANELQRVAAQLAPESPFPTPPVRPALYARNETPQAAHSARFGRNEAACQRARSYFYRAFGTQDLHQKVKLYQRGLRICPESPRAHSELADVYARLAQSGRAAAELRTVLVYDPDYPGVRRRLRTLDRSLSRLEK
jgi:predicted Zn-dependent protease